MSQPVEPVIEEKQVDDSPTLTFEEYRITKRGEYQLANVPEYAIVDPAENRQRVRVMAFLEGDDVYTEVNYLPGQEMVSVVFPNLRLSVNEILNPPLVEGLIKAEQARFRELEQAAKLLHI